MTTYDKLDAALIASIKSGMNWFCLIQCGVVFQEARLVAILMDGEISRVVDRRLQALRRANKIVYTSKTGWTVVVVDQT